MKPIPPHIALKFLRWFCREDYLDEVEGDLLEIYERQASENRKKAKRMLCWNILKHLRRDYFKTIHTRQNAITMFSYNFKLAIRNFQRHRTQFFINLIGLTTGLTCAFLIYLWVQDEYSIDKFHENDDQLYQVMKMEVYNNEKTISPATPGLLGESLRADFPEVKYSAATTWIRPTLLSYENTFVREKGYHAGKDFFNIFSYPLLIGDRNTVLKDRTSICISRKLATIFYGSVENAIGQTLQYGEEQQFTVTGVFENISKNSTYVFDYVLPLQDFLDQASWANDWANTGPPTYVVLQEGTDPQVTSNKITDYLKTKVAESKTDLFLKKYSDQYLYSRYTNGVPDGGRIDYVRLFSVIGIFIIVIACINFMNLSTAQASRRALEVGIRKAIGAGRGGLIGQYIGEAVLTAFISMLLCFVFVFVLLVPFNEITGKSIILSFTPELIIVSILTVMITGILAGSYPAFYLSHFLPIQVLKNRISNSVGEIWARKGLVIFQFALTVMLIVGVVVIHRQTQYLNNKHLGYERDNVVFFQQDGGIFNRKETFFNELRDLPGVVSAGGTNHELLGRYSSNPGVEWEGKETDEKILFERFWVDYDFYETMGFKLAQGRWFSKDYSTDSSKIIINEAAAKAMGFSPEVAIGKNIALWDGFNFEVVGILKDFHYMSLHESVNPAYFRLEETNNVAARLEAGKEKEALEGIEALYKTYAPGFIFDYNFLDKSYQALYESEQRVGTLSSLFAGIAIIISCLGLFGLAAFTAERRTKEIGIRKVLGASVTSVVMLLSRDFIRLVLIAIVIALPLSYLFMQEWLTQFAYTIDLSIWIFLSAALTALVIAWLTVSMQTFKAANINPAECIKDE